MEPHSIDPVHDLVAPHHDGVFGPLLWVDTKSGEIWPDGSNEEGTRVKALLVWVGMPVAAVSEGVGDAELPKVSQRLRAYLRRHDIPIVYTRGWLPEKVGVKVSTDSPHPVSPGELARAAAHVLVGAAWFDRETVVIELEGKRFEFEVRESLDEAGRVFTVIKAR